MKSKLLKLSIVVLILFSCFFVVEHNSSQSIYRDVLNKKIYLSILNPSTTYKITFDSQGGSSVDPIYKTINSEIGSLPTSTKTNNNFVGWYTEPYGQGTKITPNTVVTSDVTYYANWVGIVCKKAIAETIHTESCDTGGGCLNLNYIVGNPIKYGTVAGAGDPVSGNAYDCDVNGDGVYSPTTERFYYIRSTTDSTDNAVLVHYTSFDEYGQMDSSNERKNYNYSDGKAHLPDSTIWSNPALVSFDGKVSRYINIDDIETACGGTVVYNSVNYLNTCQYFMENSRFQSGSLGRAGIWIEKYDNKLHRIQTSSVAVQIPTDANSLNTVRPVIEIPYNTIDGYRERIAFTVSFNSLGGSSVSPITKYENQPIGALPTPTHPDYTFGGWYTDTNYTNEVTSSTLVTANVTYYAKWNEINDDLKTVFYIPGTCSFGGPNGSITSSSDDCISIINPTGQNIDYTKGSLATKKYIDTGISLYSAENKDKDYEINFEIVEYNFSNQVTQATLMNTKFESTGYPGLVFRVKNSTNFELASRRNSTTNTTNTILSSELTKFTIYRINNEIYYSVNGGQKKFSNNLNEYNPTFNLTTWFGAAPSNGEGTTSQRYFYGTLKNLYIRLEDASIVTFNAHDGTSSLSEKEVKTGSAIGELPTATKSGYYFDGWYTEEHGGRKIDETEVINDDVTFHAQYKDIYLVTFNAYGGTLSIPQNTVEVVDGNTISQLPTATKPGYYFDGWYTAEHGGTKYQGNEVVTADVTYHAHYKVIHTITFNTYGGTLSIPQNTLEVLDGEIISELPTATKSGYYFDGWYTEEHGGTRYQGNEVVTSDATYHAHWDESGSEVHTVTFKDSDNTTVIDTVQVVGANSLGLSMPANPTKENYVFAGWYINGQSLTPFTSETIVTGNITVVARWKQKLGLATVTTTPDPLLIKLGRTGQITVTASDGGLVEDYTYSSSNTGIVTVVNGTVYGEDIGSATITITGSESGQTRTIPVTITNLHTITFDPGNNEPVTTIQVVDGSTIGNNAPSDPTNSGYVFDRWYLFEENSLTTTPLDTTKHITDDEVYKAKWVESNIVAAIGTTYFSTLQAAINAAPTSGVETEIRILQDINNPSGRTTVDDGRYVVIIGGNHTVSCGISTTNNLLYVKKGKLRIKSGTFTCNQEKLATLENNASSTLYIDGGTITNTLNTALGRSAIYNYGTVYISGGEISSEALERSVVQNSGNSASIYMSGGTVTQLTTSITNNTGSGAIKVIGGSSATITGGTIISNSTNSAAIYNQGSLVIGESNDAYSTTSPVIQGEQYGIESTANYSIYDGIIKGKNNNKAVNDFSKINGTESNSIRITDTDGAYYTLYYSIEALKYRINFNANGGTVSNYRDYNLNQVITTSDLPTPTKGVYTFDGWYTDSELTTPFSSFTPATADTAIYYAKWSFSSTLTPVNYTITSNAVTDYFANISSWVPDNSNNHTTFQNHMFDIFTINDCSVCNGINTCSSPSAGTYCEQQKEFNTALSDDLDVYLYENNQKGSLVTYTTSLNGNIYNMIPGTTYYWESKTDNTKYGVVKAVGERRTIKSSVRNIRDLGGFSVSYTDLETHQTVTGTTDYGRLYRGAQIGTNQAFVSELTKLGITREIDLRANDDGNTGHARLSNYDDDQNPDSSKRDIVITNYLINPTATTYISEAHLDEYRKVKNALRKTMEYVVNGDNIFFHCTIGTDRTGTLAYFLEGLLGVSEEDRLRDYELTYFYGLTNRTRYHDYLSGSSINPRFESMYKSYPTNQDIYNYYTYERYVATGDELDDDELLTAFRNAMINKN